VVLVLVIVTADVQTRVGSVEVPVIQKQNPPTAVQEAPMCRDKNRIKNLFLLPPPARAGSNNRKAEGKCPLRI